MSTAEAAGLDPTIEVDRLRAQVAAMEQLLEVHERTVEDQSRRLEAALADVATRNDDLERSNRELELFAYIASHDLQEPLRVITSYVQLLEQRYGDLLDERGRRYVGFTVDGAQRMQALINGLLEYSRTGTREVRPETVALDEVLEHVRRDLARAIADSGATVRAGALPTVRADATQMRQLLQNLVGNAIKFRGERAPVVELSGEVTPAGAVVHVRDNGIGIEPRFAERIFQIFQRLHPADRYEGTGIGLSICRRIVERHGGTLTVASDPGQGTTFTFTLPHAGEA